MLLGGDIDESLSEGGVAGAVEIECGGGGRGRTCCCFGKDIIGGGEDDDDDADNDGEVEVGI